MRLAWPLTGRSEELRIIEAAIAAADVAGIVVSGAAGVGKSRIAREALASAAEKGRKTHWAVGTSSARAVPLGAFAPWVGPSSAATLQLVREVIHALTSSSPGTTVVIGVDDVYLLDDLSSFVLHQIVQRRAAKVVVTVRDGEPLPDWIREVWKTGDLDRLDVQPLSRDETTMLLSETLGGPVDPDASRRLWTLTRGNVLYLTNIVEQEVADGRLRRQHGVWRWTGDPVVPPGLVELIGSRIGALPAPVAEVLDALAVGEPLELAALTRITDAAAVEEADRRGLISLGDGAGAQVRVAHPLYGEVRRKRAVATTLRRLRGLVARALAAGEDADDMRTVVRRATLTLESDLEPDPDLLVRAAQGAVWLADLPLADRLADAAIRAGAGAEANFIRAHALSWLSRGQECDTVLAHALTRGFADVDDSRLVFMRASNLLWTLAEPAAAKALADEALSTAPLHARGCIDAFLTEYWAAMGKPERAKESSRGLVLAELPKFCGTHTSWGAAAASGDAGRTSEAVAAAEVGYAIVERGFEAPHMRFGIGDGHVGALLQAGRIKEAGVAAERLQREAADLPGGAELLSAAVAGRAALGAGRLRTACSLLKPAVEVFHALGETNGWGYRFQVPLAIALAMRGAIDEAADMVATLDTHQHPGWRLIDYERELARAWVAAAQGSVSEAIVTALSAAEMARENGQFAAEVICLQAATQFGERSCEPRLRELAGIVEGPRVALAARFAAAMQAGDGAELDAVSRHFERIGDLVAAVDAAAHAAVAYRRQALRGSAYGCTQRAEALAERCEGASTPALWGVDPLPMTHREQEIVRLLGQGLSTREIAERLTVSVRTVEGHIYRAMAKTGVSSREELVALLPRRSLKHPRHSLAHGAQF